ncbi:MAG TPA: CHAT domain-containing protein [Myxococcales bacterium]|nr:CHAT domain-containing protein [Myxococcales bacterium]
MTPECADLQPYADGELDAARLPAFETHLVSCADCQRGFADLMQLATLAEQAAPSAPARATVQRISPARRFLRPAPVMAMAASLLLAAGTSAFLWRLSAAPSAELWLANAPARMLEARVSRKEADRYRPYSVPRSERAQVAPPSLTELGALERRGDQRGIAVAYLVRRQPEQAAPYLDASGSSPEDEVDRAAAALLKNDSLGALEHADRALRSAPGSAQARWNRAIALRELGLSRSAAKDFEEVAARGEPGWSEEARRWRDALAAGSAEAEAAWDALGQACKALITSGTPLPPEQVRRIRGWSRACFYDGLRAATSRDRALALLPTASVLDELYGDTAATGAVRQVAARDFTRREPLAKTYAALATGALPAAEVGPYLDRLRASPESDLLLGALLFAPDLPQHLDEYRKLAEATGDPWFLLLAEEKQGYAEVSLDQLARSEERLQRALEKCGPGSRQNYRCAWLERSLSVAYTMAHQPAPAREHALKALARASQGGEWFLERKVLIDLGQIARFENDLPRMEAYLGEALLKSKDGCSEEAELIHVNLALAYQKSCQFAQARRHLDQVAGCPRPASLFRAFAVADVSRQLPAPDDEAVIRKGLEALRASPAEGPGRLAMATHVEGRFQIEKDRARGQALLRQAIDAAARQPPPDVEAQKARMYSYTSLILDAGKHGEHARALELFAEELGVPPPPGCALGVTADDERTLVLARGPSGELRGRYDASRTAPLSGVSGLVPEELRSLLRGCPSVEVIARPPLVGQADLLPPDVPWSYRVSRGPPASSRLPARRLIVSGTAPPPSLHLSPLGLPALAGEDPSTVVLRGEAATPARVLEAMGQATEIDLHAHGLMDPERADASFLALSPEPTGRFALTAADLERTRLEGNPVVLLAACYGAKTTRSLSESYGLPPAFIHAGARAVLAATQEIPDAEAAGFFEPVLQRIRGGEPAAVALRDARVRWVAAGGGRWVEQVLLFE